MRNARASPAVLLVLSWNGIDIIKKLHLCPFEWHRCNFLIKKITSMPSQENTRRTPGDTLAFLLKHIGLKLFNDSRLTNQLKKNKKYAKQELRSFSPSLIAPYKKSYKSTNFKHNRKQPVCYKYGQISHYKYNCKVKVKIKKLNIDDILSESDTKSEELLQIDDNNTTSKDDEYLIMN
jgi:hypothetical protein